MREAVGTAVWRLGEAVRAGWWDYRALYSPAILATTVGPRVLLQCGFVALIGVTVGGTGAAAHAYVGALGYLVTFASIAKVPMVLIVDREEGTFGRLRLGVIPLPLVVLARAVPYAVESVAIVVACLVLAPLFGLQHALVRLLATIPVFAVMAVTSLAFGVLATALAVGRRVEGMTGNALCYVVLVCGGVIVEPGTLPWADAVGAVIPIRHGLAAVRAVLDGRPWTGQLATELIIGAAWGTVATLVLNWQSRRAYRLGHDDFV